MIRVLFVCIHNSARSQMAEAFLNAYGKDMFVAESAGIEPGKLNPYVVRAMKELGFDFSARATKSTQEMMDRGTRFDYVITVCDAASGERCPYFPGTTARYHWELKDPSQFCGSEDEIMQQVRAIRDDIAHRVQLWLTTFDFNHEGKEHSNHGN